MIKLDETDFAMVALYEDIHLITVTWKEKSLSFSDYKHPFVVALNYQKDSKTPIFNYISDVRKQTVVSPQYRKWFQDTALPRAVNQGLKRGAVVTDANVFKRYYLNHIMNSTKHFGLPLKMFKQPENALKWFKSCLDDDLKNIR